MEKYVKLPVEIRAIQFTDENKDRVLNELRSLHGGGGIYPIGTRLGEEPAMIIPTLEGEMKVSLNDWVIQGVNGELYPCKPDIFKKTYIRVNEDK